MPKPIELALSQIWSRKSIECLNATQLGAFISLARANLIHGIDPLPSDRDSLQRLSRTSRIQWASSVDRILEALKDALPVLRTSYKAKADMAEIRKEHVKVARIALAKKNSSKAKLETKIPHDFADADKYSVGVLQPLMASRYLPQDYDRQARNAAISAKTDSTKQTLAD